MARFVGAVLALVMFGVAVFAGAVVWREVSSEEIAVATPKVVVAEIATLRDEYNTTGVVGFGEAQPLLSPASGLVTAVMVSPGGVLVPGRAFMSVDNLSVYINPLPFLPHRMLESGVRGDDVEALEVFLVDGGFFDKEPDDHFTRVTKIAVEAWQEASGLDVSGKVDPAQFMAAPDRLQVEDVLVRVGEVISQGQAFATSTNDVPVINTRVIPRVAGRITDDVVLVMAVGDGEPVGVSVESVGELVSDESGVRKQELFLSFDVVTDDVRTATGGTVTFLFDERVDVVTVPVTALLSPPDSAGQSFVLIPDGVSGEPVRITVQVGLISQGVAEIVEGISVGDTVVIGFERG
ncbi:hypothetical protein MNBD_ACTINO02-3163 [hydrothermal vent metagenome]|uniref:Peptidoglycan binding-like domain-containing protein n=1 Tax=hydrothermal vent metagenome TaxID=652676 RepID=A0A3B0RJI2_9ZZZZ